MYTLFELATSAFSKISHDFADFTYSETNQTENKLVKSSVRTTLNAFQKAKLGDKTYQFETNPTCLSGLESQLRPMFMNITKLIDWVTWEKCKLHAKMQLAGLSAVMKIVINGDQKSELSRNEIVGFVNLTRKLSNSIKWYNDWLYYEHTEMVRRQYVFYVVLLLWLFTGYLTFHFLSKGPDSFKNDHYPLSQEEDKEL